QSFAGGLNSSLFDYLSPDTKIIIDDEIGVKNSLDTFQELIEERELRFKSERYLIPSKAMLYFSSEEVLGNISARDCDYIDQVNILEDDEEKSGKSVHITSLSNTELSTVLKTKIGSGNALSPLVSMISKWRRQGLSIAFVVSSPVRAERLQRYLLDVDLDAEILSKTGISWVNSPRRSPLVILSGFLNDGFRIPEKKICFISENEIFAERSYRQKKHSKTSLKKLLSAISNLQEGDFVVHVDYGIGVYKGLKQLNVDEVLSDFFQIDYADSRLYLPVQNIGRIQKFVAQEGQVPSLDRLGAPQRWIKTKLKVRDAVASLAGDLIKLYASRNISKGWHFDIIGAEDERFADYFPYDETPDQLKAIEETLSDMASEKIMDRLVCGDVGFGKTEVALRAAFKCIQHAKQVALLVPTTILAEQHCRTFQNRFNEYPVKVGVLSRFYDARANKETLKKVASGEIDIVIGTHKLLQRDVQFKDLGLLIIDEEHRFGVAQKEKLKQFRRNVDVLTLTATPIPRTLHMSLLGIRDISIISTPPVDRRAIRTYIANYDENLVRDAILRELHRGGQCFFVHNRIGSIDLITAELSRLVPEARFRYAHGQMSEGQLEPIILSFLRGEFDVLVCTTIIESGIDMPNCNTMIIDRADMYGLAQLYQLRGRVGRSDRQAYAYFLIPESRKLGSEAQKRLKALQSLDDLGLGFNLAIRDLEIRGAGNLLGREQSGSVLSVGYELYSKILKEAILNLKGEELSLEESIDPEVKISSSAYIPDTYIPDISERLVLYQRLASLAYPEEAYEMADEIRDRFGPLPEEVENLIELMRYRTLLRGAGVLRVEQSPQKVTFYFSPRARVDAQKILNLVEEAPNNFKFSKNLAFSMNFASNGESNIQHLYSETERLLAKILQ
ncbi:MAG: transcription-repair coupling factor, partial [SAR324 cluster bacterium]|nr:transcription-repair coupling factor [SAR324 cluster bacterium]